MVNATHTNTPTRNPHPTTPPRPENTDTWVIDKLLGGEALASLRREHAGVEWTELMAQARRLELERNPLDG